MEVLPRRPEFPHLGGQPQDPRPRENSFQQHHRHLSHLGRRSDLLPSPTAPPRASPPQKLAARKQGPSRSTDTIPRRRKSPSRLPTRVSTSRACKPAPAGSSTSSSVRCTFSISKSDGKIGEDHTFADHHSRRSAPACAPSGVNLRRRNALHVTPLPHRPARGH